MNDSPNEHPIAEPLAEEPLAEEPHGEKPHVEKPLAAHSASGAHQGIPVQAHAGSSEAGGSEAGGSEAVGSEADDDDDGTPAELADPFAGDENAKPVSEAEDDNSAPVGDRQWYILKVQSNREDSIREALLRRISMQGLDRFFGDVVVPKEQVTEFKSG